MTINFSVGDYVVPNQAYIEGSLKYDTGTPVPTLQQSLEALGYLVNLPSRVTAVGNLALPNPLYSYISVLPTDSTSLAYNNGQGITIYFRNDTLLNNSLEVSSSFIPSDTIVRCLNNSGSTITKNSVVRQTGFDATSQAPTIGLASAAAESTSVILGVVQEDITNNTEGAVLIQGSYQADTSSFALNAKVYLSNTNGAISTTAGTIPIAIGKVLNVSTTGSILLAWELTLNVGDVTGPNSSTDDAIPRFLGTTGKTLESSAASVSDQGHLQSTTIRGTQGIVGFDGGANTTVRTMSGSQRFIANNTITSVATFPTSSNTGRQITVNYGIEVQNGTDVQSVSGTLNLAVVNKAGTLTLSSPSSLNEVQAVSAGTVSVIWAFTASGSNALLRVTINSSLTSPTNIQCTVVADYMGIAVIGIPTIPT